MNWLLISFMMVSFLSTHLHPMQKMKRAGNNAFKRLHPLVTSKGTAKFPNITMPTSDKNKNMISAEFTGAHNGVGHKPVKFPKSIINQFSQPIVEGESVEFEPKKLSVEPSEELLEPEIIQEEVKMKAAQEFNEQQHTSKVLKDDNGRWWLVSLDNNGQPDLTIPYEQQIFNHQTEKFEADTSAMRKFLRGMGLIKPSFKKSAFNQNQKWSYTTIKGMPFAKNIGLAQSKFAEGRKSTKRSYSTQKNRDKDKSYVTYEGRRREIPIMKFEEEENKEENWDKARNLAKQDPFSTQKNRDRDKAYVTYEGRRREIPMMKSEEEEKKEKSWDNALNLAKKDADHIQTAVRQIKRNAISGQSYKSANPYRVNVDMYTDVYIEGLKNDDLNDLDRKFNELKQAELGQNYQKLLKQSYQKNKDKIEEATKYLKALVDFIKEKHNPRCEAYEKYGSHADFVWDFSAAGQAQYYANRDHQDIYRLHPRYYWKKNSSWISKVLKTIFK